MKNCNVVFKKLFLGNTTPSVIIKHSNSIGKVEAVSKLTIFDEKIRGDEYRLPRKLIF